MTVSQPLREPLTDDRAWSASTIDGSADWTYTLSDSCLAALDKLVQSVGGDAQAATDIRLEETDLDVCRAGLQAVDAALHTGRGFAVIERAPLERYSVQEAQAMYWMIGQILGRPFEQNIEGTLLYDVRDTGRDVGQGARFSVTNKESSFHTDGAFNPSVPDIVGLLCLQTAKSGGESQLISACTLYNELLTHHPDLLEILYQPFCFDRRGQFKAGEKPVTQSPIFQWDGQELILKYLYYYIQVGHDVAGQPLSRDQARALAVVEELLRDPKFRVEFSLQPGQMLFTNNLWILHNRTGFVDHPEPERRRHYVRLWLKRKERPN